MRVSASPLCRLPLFYILVSLASAGFAQTPEPDAPDINLQLTLERTKAKVFPALVFVKPIVEDFSAGERKQLQVFGSGVIISPDGQTLTNNHVVDKSVHVDCVLHNKQQVSARIIGRDKDTDLALMQLDVPEEWLPLPYVKFADSHTVTEGDFVMALGSPFGFTRSISLGIVSNTQRYIGFETEYRYNTWIQTDAAINPGNSGGPLVNIRGEVVGINTLGVFLADNIGFAIPSSVAERIAERLKRDGKIERAWSGMRLQPLNDFFTNTFTETTRGVLIADVDSGSPADDAGVLKGDVLFSLGGQEMTASYAEDLPDVEWRIADLPVGQPLTMTVLRDDTEIELSVSLLPKGKTEGESFDCRRWNMTVKEITRHDTPDLHFYRHSGVFVLGVTYPGNAEAAGLRPRDIITSIDGAPIDDLDAVRSTYGRLNADEARDKEVLIEVLRNGYKKWVNLEYRKDYDKE